MDRNSRTIGDIETEKPDLCASVRRHGVRVPVIVRPVEEGRYRVQDGHCRTIIAASLPGEDHVVPAIITESEDEQRWAWLRDQWLANEVRSGYGSVDAARIFEELTLFGLSAEQVADELSVDVGTVEAGLRTRCSGKVTDALRIHPQLSLLQAAELVEFEGDEDAYRDLTETLETDPAGLDHALAEWRLTYRSRAACAQLADELRGVGVEVVGDYAPAGALRLDRLYRSRKDRVRLDGEDAGHGSCPGHAAYITTNNAEGVATAGGRAVHRARLGGGRPRGAAGDGTPSRLRLPPARPHGSEAGQQESVGGQAVQGHGGSGDDGQPRGPAGRVRGVHERGDLA
ncbi:ParB N-terminal domain-containing protein [Actinosynnema sp. NPDC047251]|nr:ParB N-terminal domain-containing protein [Saccharothrix espanaensis]